MCKFKDNVRQKNANNSLAIIFIDFKSQNQTKSMSYNFD